MRKISLIFKPMLVLLGLILLASTVFWYVQMILAKDLGVLLVVIIFFAYSFVGLIIFAAVIAVYYLIKFIMIKFRRRKWK